MLQVLTFYIHLLHVTFIVSTFLFNNIFQKTQKRNFLFKEYKKIAISLNS
jgi:hypothetical protein